MGSRDRLGAEDLRAAMVAYRDLLRDHQQELNRLNVYPVPDGDTGTNMSLTMESVVAALDGATDMAATCKAIGHGSLMGARGNSGVILSQILRGVADVLSEHGGDDGAEDGSEDDGAEDDGADGVALARALTTASAAARAAVMRPVEGTILTVVREAAAAAALAGAGDGQLVGVLDAARAGAGDALARTPELLPVLAQAGVVDAGGAGLVLLLDALLHVCAGRPLPSPPSPRPGAPPDGQPATSTAGRQPATATAGRLTPAGESVDDGGPSAAAIDLRYEVMYLLDAPDETIAELKRLWSAIGDSIVVVGGDGVWNCHIHTDDIGAAVEAGLDCGRPRRIRVTDLLEQVEEERWVREAPPAEPPPSGPVTTAVVAVAAGDGIRRILLSLGVRAVVAGGQSMNPSTAQILEAVEAVGAREVVVLPNNRNIVAVAEQVRSLTAKHVRVLPTISVAEGFAALMEYDPDAGAEANVEAMTGATSRVISAEVTRAVRDAPSPVGPIREGEYLGLTGGEVSTVDPALAEATCRLLEGVVSDAHEIVTVIEGEGSSAAATRRVTEWLAERYPSLEVEVHHGGQPLYPYLLSVE